jgi:PAS domain S-box-containing protein
MPLAATQMEDAIFVLAAHVFLKTSDYLPCLDTLARLFGPACLQYLLLFLAFVRAAHYWTETHPEIAFEEDINELLATHEALADCILNDPEARDTVSQSLLDELPALRLKADKAIGLLAAIVDSSEDAIVSPSQDGIITNWNASAERLLGHTVSEAIGQHISLMIPFDRRDEETVIIERIKRGERIEHFDTVRVGKDKKPIEISLTISPVQDASGKIIGASRIARDISQRKRMERELRESEERYRTLADALDIQVQFRTQELERRNSELRDTTGRLIDAQEQECRRIAREIHDDYSQRLALLAIEVENLAEENPNSSAEMSQRFHQIWSGLSEVGADLHSLSHRLHSSTLDSLGLVAGVKAFCKEFAEQQKIQVDFADENVPTGVPGNVAVCLFRIVQEGLRNVKRHSGVDKAGVRLEKLGEKLHLSVTDQGRGFDTQTRSAEGGIGIRSMEERLRSLGGKLEIHSGLMEGTRIEAWLPLSVASENAA